MCIPKHYLKPQHSPLQLSLLYDLDSPAWGFAYTGGRRRFPPPARHASPALDASERSSSAPCWLPCSGMHGPALTLVRASLRAAGPAAELGAARVLFAPDTRPVRDLMAHLARAAACPDDPKKSRAGSTSFYQYFRPPGSAPAGCRAGGRDACMRDSRCYAGLLEAGGQLEGASSAEAAAAEAARLPGTVDAILDFTAWAAGAGAGSSRLYSYELRLNHTALPPTRVLLDAFAAAPGTHYRRYHWAANLQALVDAAIVAHAAAALRPAAPAPRLLPSFKPFPWPAFTLDLGATAAALFFNLLLVYAFLGPTRAAVAAVVQEKELGLREGLRLQGLRDAAYWGSWAASHWGAMAASGALCAALGAYPFRRSSPALLLAFYWLVAAALLGFAYCLSCMFGRARVAGTAAGVIYAVAMLPGWVAVAAVGLSACRDPLLVRGRARRCGVGCSAVVVSAHALLFRALETPGAGPRCFLTPVYLTLTVSTVALPRSAGTWRPRCSRTAAPGGRRPACCRPPPSPCWLTCWWRRRGRGGG
jgi:hypothetical protein